MIGKKGLSPIIASVLLIMLTIAAIALLSSFVIPFIKEKLSDSTECLEFRDYFYFETNEDIAYNCYGGKDYKLTISARDNGAKNTPEGFVIKLGNEGVAKSINLINGEESEAIMLDGTKTIKIPKIGETYSYNFSTTDQFVSAELYPLTNSGKICERNDYTKITPCTK